MIPYQHRTISDTGITDRKTQRQNKNWVKMGLLIFMSISWQEKVCEPLDFSCVPLKMWPEIYTNPASWKRTKLNKSWGLCFWFEGGKKTKTQNPESSTQHRKQNSVNMGNRPTAYYHKSAIYYTLWWRDAVYSVGFKWLIFHTRTPVDSVLAQGYFDMQTGNYGIHAPSWTSQNLLLCVRRHCVCVVKEPPSDRI